MAKAPDLPCQDLPYQGLPTDIEVLLPTINFQPLRGRPRGEVCMALRRPCGGYLVQTKAEYPGGVLRLPTGGIDLYETPEHAFVRESWEETGLRVIPQRYLARIHYRSPTRKARFVTHILTADVGSEPLTNNDPNEHITEWRAADRAALEGCRAQLGTLHNTWSPWGTFRAAAIDALVSLTN